MLAAWQVSKVQALPPSQPQCLTLWPAAEGGHLGKLGSRAMLYAVAELLSDAILSSLVKEQLQTSCKVAGHDLGVACT